MSNRVLIFCHSLSFTYTTKKHMQLKKKKIDRLKVSIVQKSAFFLPWFCIAVQSIFYLFCFLFFSWKSKIARGQLCPISHLTNKSSSCCDKQSTFKGIDRQISFMHRTAQVKLLAESDYPILFYLFFFYFIFH